MSRRLNPKSKIKRACHPHYDGTPRNPVGSRPRENRAIRPVCMVSIRRRPDAPRCWRGTPRRRSSSHCHPLRDAPKPLAPGSSAGDWPGSGPMRQTHMHAQQLARHNRRRGGKFNPQTGCADVFGLAADILRRRGLEDFHWPMLMYPQTAPCHCRASRVSMFLIRRIIIPTAPFASRDCRPVEELSERPARHFGENPPSFAF